MRVRVPLLVVAVFGSAVAGMSCSSGGGSHAIPPEGLTSQQQAATEAVAASGAMHALVFGVREMIALGNTTATITLSAPTPPPAGTPDPTATDTPNATGTGTTSSPTASDTATASPSGSTATPTGSGSATASPTVSLTGFTGDTGSTTGDATPTPTPTPGLGGDYSDPDGNGIPQDVTLVMSAPQFPAPVGIGATQAVFTTTDQHVSASASTIGDYRGGITLAVDASEGLSFGWKKVSDIFRTTYQSTNQSAGSLYEVTSSYADISSFTTDTAGHGHRCASAGNWTIDYTPPAGWVAASTPTAGTITIANNGGSSGYVAVDGTATVFNVTMFTTTPLTLNAATCGASLIESGTLQVAFSTTSSFAVNWTGCNATAQPVAP